MRGALLRIVTCGSVDDGKSTLIGRLLAETGSVPEDTLEAARWTRRTGSAVTAGDIDYSLLTDGLESEREQGITIDVAYRHLELSATLRAIVADAPGHEQFTRNMVVAASTADVGILLVDAARGVRTQTFRHLYVCAMMRVSTVVIAVNKMDAVDFDEAVFDSLSRRVRDAAASLGIAEVHTIPVSALRGDNVTQRSDVMTWYHGPTLLGALAAVPPARVALNAPPRLPVQMVLRSPDYRGYAGTLVSGSLRVGDEVSVGRSGVRARVASLTVAGSTATEASAGQAIAVALDREIDLARGDLLLPPEDAPAANDRFSCELVWLHERPLARGRSYLLVSGPLSVPATVTGVRDKVDVESGHLHSTRDLHINEIGHVEIATDAPVVLDSYSQVRDTGSFLLVDRVHFDTVAAGLVVHPMRRGVNVHEQHFEVDRAARQELSGHAGKVIWLTGLPGSGKSTIAARVEKALHLRGIHTYVLDGDNLRLGLNKDLGFTPEDRAENVRRVGEVSRLMMDAGLVVLVCLVSPVQEDRDAVRERFAPGEFCEVFVNTPLAVCQERDPKGLYRKAKLGVIPNLTGVGQDYEVPQNPELVADGAGDVDSAVEAVVRLAVS
jgi:bifunctional enzyme CysN/CysC